MPAGHWKVLVKNYLFCAAFNVTKVGDISSSECFVIKRRRRCKITEKGGDWEECGSLLWTCLGGIAVCGQRQCAFVPDQSWPYWQTNLWLGGVSVSVLSVGATERNSRGEEKRASKKWGGGGGERKEACMEKSLWDTLRLTKKDSGHFSVVGHRGSFVACCCWRRREMLTQTDQKERPSAVYSTVVSISHGRGQREHSPGIQRMSAR